eukprot:CAMPEP_0198522088 /NCGR_PEP_ID=MMETSP1462-20131121/21328_1 /TAXON_ID=1333877 /ORGANISM="Brandtodinium nutriculum, Strain RCC3387" /LENGTH=331 /DNA_ID=CAMNT_0044251747 /DNA_START=37 /DNA_END=1028 /DNA_ORIENTATION=+
MSGFRRSAFVMALLGVAFAKQLSHIATTQAPNDSYDNKDDGASLGTRSQPATDSFDTADEPVKLVNDGEGGKRAQQMVQSQDEAARLAQLLPSARDDEYRGKLIRILRKEGAKALTQAVEALTQALGDGAALADRRSATRSLGMIGGVRVVQPLIRALGDADISVRKEAVEALREIGPGLAVEPLIQALGDASLSGIARAHAATLLGMLGGADVVQSLEQALQQRGADARVRRRAAHALLEVGLVEAWRALEAFQDDAEAFVRKQAAEAVARIANPPPFDECSICQERLRPGQVVTATSCNHKFHEACLSGVVQEEVLMPELQARQARPYE